MAQKSAKVGLVFITAALGLALFQLLSAFFTADKLVTIEPPAVYRVAVDGVPREFETMPMATPTAIHSVTSPETAERLLTAAKRVFDHYTFANRPARRPPPKEYESFFASAPIGLCESASLTFGKLIEEEFVARNFNVVTPRWREPHAVIEDNYRLTGHTFSVVRLESGSIGVDTTYGAILVSDAPDFDNDVLRSRNFKMYSLFDWDNAEEDCFRNHLRCFAWTDDDSTFGSYSGDYFQVNLPVLRLPSSTRVRVGTIDGSDLDMLDLFGGWGNHLGLWYEHSQHIWRFSPEIAGEYEVTFHLLGGDRSFVLSEPFEFDFAVEGGELVECRAVPSRTDPEILSWLVRFDGDFQIRIRSLAVAARLIDGIEIRRLPLGERIAGATARGAAGLVASFCLRAPDFPACSAELVQTSPNKEDGIGISMSTL